MGKGVRKVCKSSSCYLKEIKSNRSEIQTGSTVCVLGCGVTSMYWKCRASQRQIKKLSKVVVILEIAQFVELSTVWTLPNCQLFRSNAWQD